MTRENLETYFQDCDREHKHPKKWWDLLDELGLFSMFLPEEAGGDGEDVYKRQHQISAFFH